MATSVKENISVPAQDTMVVVRRSATEVQDAECHNSMQHAPDSTTVQLSDRQKQGIKEHHDVDCLSNLRSASEIWQYLACALVGKMGCSF